MGKVKVNALGISNKAIIAISINTLVKRVRKHPVRIWTLTKRGFLNTITRSKAHKILTILAQLLNSFQLLTVPKIK